MVAGAIFTKKNLSRNFLNEYASKILYKKRVPDQSIHNIAPLDWNRVAMGYPKFLYCFNKDSFWVKVVSVVWVSSVTH